MNAKRTILPFIFLALLACVSMTACSGSTSAQSPTLTPLESQGRGVFDAYCSRCHEKSGDTVIVGPSLGGIAVRGGTRIEGMEAEEYIRDSILNPTAYTVEKFPEGTMPLNFKDELSQADLDAVVAFLLTLK